MFSSVSTISHRALMWASLMGMIGLRSRRMAHLTLLAHLGWIGFMGACSFRLSTISSPDCLAAISGRLHLLWGSYARNTTCLTTVPHFGRPIYWQLGLSGPPHCRHGMWPIQFPKICYGKPSTPMVEQLKLAIIRLISFRFLFFFCLPFLVGCLGSSWLFVDPVMIGWSLIPALFVI